MVIVVNVRKWGNSMGIVLPKEMVRHQRLKENDRIIVEVVKEADLTGLFGSLKRKMSGQGFKERCCRKATSRRPS